MVIRQGDVFWISQRPPVGSEPGFRHPFVVVQSDRFNQSKIQTIIACPLTSNLNLANAPGNVLLAKHEANLPKRSVVNVSQLSTFDRASFDEKIGTISKRRLGEVLAGIALVLAPGD